MRNFQNDMSVTHHVSITYGDGAHSFWLARGTTLGELALHVSGLDTLHNSQPLTIDIVVESARRPASAATHASN
jgi:hypothetical protein